MISIYMENKFKNIQKNLNEIICEINNEREYNDNIETDSLKKLKKFNEKINKYNTIEWRTSYVTKTIKETFDTLLNIVVSQNKRITELEKQIETIHEGENNV